MANLRGFCLQANDKGESVTNSGSENFKIFVILTAALVGNLVINGIVDGAGAPVSFTITGGTGAGVSTAPGSGKNGGGPVSYAYANVSDVGKAIIVCVPV